jgi:5-hydroxyisourate hydrolase-like protein (transthyretin family)
MKEENEKKLIQDLVTKIEKTEKSEEMKSIILSVKFKTLWDKLDTHQTTNEGKIIIPLIQDESLKFNNYEEYYTWKEKKKAELKEKIFRKLTPMEYYITQEKGTERPFTGDYWDFNKVGVYSCKVCTQRVFSSTHKYNSKSGHATFWNFLPYTINFHNDHLDFPEPTQAIYKIPFINNKPVKRIACSNVYKS